MKIKRYPLIKRLFQQYQENTIPQREKEIIDNWFETYENGPEPELFQDPETEQRIYNELQQRLKQGITPVRTLWPLPVWIKAACVLIGVSIISTLYFRQRNSKTTTQQQAYQTISTANGQVKKITLDDSTEVWLNAATSIRIALFKDDKNRIVYLDKGEAFFKVKHDTERPFSVITGNIITRDIGTAFNIRAYDLKKEFRIAVASGKVDVSRIDRSGKLHVISAGIEQGQALLYTPNSDQTRMIRKDVAMISSWKSGNSVYVDGMTLTEIGEELSRHFNISVTVSNPQLDTDRFTLNLGNQTLTQILQHLTLTAGISYSLDNHHLIINPPDKQ